MKRVATLLGILALLLAWAAAPVYAQDVRPRETDNTKDAEDAIEDAEDTEDPNEARVHYQTAMAAAEAAIAEDATNPLAHRLAALAALGLEQFAAAGRHFDRAAELYEVYELQDQPIREQAWIDRYQLAVPLVNGGDYEGAVAVLEDAHALYQGRPEAIIIMSQIYGQLGEFEQSLQYIDQTATFLASEEAATADSATVAGWQSQAAGLPLLKAQVLAAASRLPEAADAYRDLLETDPGNVDHLRSLATVLMQDGDQAGALAVYEDLLTRPGLTGLDYYQIGVGFYQAGDYARAAEAFGGAAEENPRDRDSLELWASALALDSLYAEVPPVAERWIELDPNSQTAYMLLAQSANQIGDTETTQQAVAAAGDLEVAVDQMQLQRFGAGGGVVSGSLLNKTLEEGASVTIRFTFYGSSGDPIGSVNHTMTVGAVDMSEFFDVDFDSMEIVGGYSYELTVG